MKFIDYLFLYSMLIIWLLLLTNIILTYFGYRHAIDVRAKRFNILTDMRSFPAITILIPAHNEEMVIYETVRSMLRLDYPKDKYQVVVINDGSSDRTAEIVGQFKDERLKLINIPPEEGGLGKSNALNYGLRNTEGEYIAVYDADNTPNKLALRYLSHEIHTHRTYGAVIGKFRTRNKDRNLLTRFINIETLSFQWMAQAGRWKLFGLCTIPGTNFIVRRSLLEEIGGWDINAIAEDTELSFRIYQMGYEIASMPLAETFEQEPETLRVWFRQRTRWVNGNIYVLTKHMKTFIKGGDRKILFDLYYYFSVYFLFLSSIVVSDAIYILGIFTDYKISIQGNFTAIWVLTYLIFVFQILIALSIEKGEIKPYNVFLVFIMYFTYCQLWMFVSFNGIFKNIVNNVLKRKTKWYKTERF